MKARIFEKTNNIDNASVDAMKAAVLAAGGRKWGDHNDDWIVEFDDGSYYSAAVMNPEYGDAYFNGSAKWNPNTEHNDFIELAVCTDCIMLIANGELPPDSDETTDRLLEEGCAGVMYGGEDLGFSYRACDCCRRPLGGDRFRAYKKGE